MNSNIAIILSDAGVIAGLRSAWLESNPGIMGGHEEGGFIVRELSGALAIHRWPRGSQKYIDPPDHPNCESLQKPILASFHTHPNTGTRERQSPSDADIRAVRDDPDLKSADYLGEFVISNLVVYLVDPNGAVHNVGDTASVLHMP